MQEIWAEIEGFSNYQISNLGRVKSLNYNNTGQEQILKPKKKKNNGLLEITLSKNNKFNYRTVCRLVIETFTDIKLNRNDIVMYKDNNKDNCSLENLYIISRGKRQEITYDLDHRYRPKYDYYGELLPTKEISRRNGIPSKTIRRRIKDLYWNIYESRRDSGCNI